MNVFVGPDCALDVSQHLWDRGNRIGRRIWNCGEVTDFSKVPFCSHRSVNSALHSNFSGRIPSTRSGHKLTYPVFLLSITVDWHGLFHTHNGKLPKFTKLTSNLAQCAWQTTPRRENEKAYQKAKDLPCMIYWSTTCVDAIRCLRKPSANFDLYHKHSLFQPQTLILFSFIFLVPVFRSFLSPLLQLQEGHMTMDAQPYESLWAQTRCPLKFFDSLQVAKH